jgi:C4-dicarboxylate transporter, DctQ subunit
MTATSPDAALRSDNLGALLRRFDGWISPVETFFNLLAALCILSLMFIGVIQIVARTMFDAPIWGYIDMVELAMAIFAFLGISYCQRLGGHVRMELGLNALSPRIQAIAELLSVLVALGVVGVLVWYGAGHAWRAYESGDSTIDAQFLVWPSKAVVPVAFALLWLRLLINALGYLRLMLSPGLEPIGIPVIEDVETQARKEASDAQAVDHTEEAKP